MSMDPPPPLLHSTSSPLPHRHLSASTTSSRRRAKSPGRRLTDAYVRSATGMEGDCVHSPVKHSPVKRSSSIASFLCSRARLTSDSAFAADRLDDNHNLSVSMDCSMGGNSVKYRTENSNNNVRLDSDDVFFVGQTRTENSYDTDTSPVRKRLRTNKISSNSLDSEYSLKPGIISRIVRMFKYLCRIIMRLFQLVLALCCIIFMASFSVVWMKNRCDHLQRNRFDLDGVRASFSKHIIGQEMALDQIVSSLDVFHSEDFAAPRVVWCVGWSGGGKSKSMDVLKRALVNASSVQYVLPSFLPSAGDQLASFVDDVVARTNPCMKDVVIVDGWDDAAAAEDTVLVFASMLLERIKEKSLHDSTANKLLLVVVGVRGSKAINREYLSQRLMDKERDELSVEQFVSIMTRTKEFDQISSLGPVTIVPYLPLEANHIRECVQRELLYVKKLVKNGLISLSSSIENEEDIATTVLERLKFLPVEYPIMASTGCKMVLSTLRLVLGDVDAKPNID